MSVKIGDRQVQTKARAETSGVQETGGASRAVDERRALELQEALQKAPGAPAASLALVAALQRALERRPEIGDFAAQAIADSEPAMKQLESFARRLLEDQQRAQASVIRSIPE